MYIFNVSSEPKNKKYFLNCVTSGFCRNVNEICALVAYYTTQNDISLPRSRDRTVVPKRR